jgi:hypothetical protein
MPIGQVRGMLQQWDADRCDPVILHEILAELDQEARSKPPAIRHPMRGAISSAGVPIRRASLS